MTSEVIVVSIEKKIVFANSDDNLFPIWDRTKIKAIIVDGKAVMEIDVEVADTMTSFSEARNEVLRIMGKS